MCFIMTHIQVSKIGSVNFLKQNILVASSSGSEADESDVEGAGGVWTTRTVSVIKTLAFLVQVNTSTRHKYTKLLPLFTYLKCTF